jgi:hypothetical protein
MKEGKSIKGHIAQCRNLLLEVAGENSNRSFDFMKLRVRFSRVYSAEQKSQNLCMIQRNLENTPDKLLKKLHICIRLDEKSNANQSRLTLHPSFLPSFCCIDSNGSVLLGLTDLQALPLCFRFSPFFPVANPLNAMRRAPCNRLCCGTPSCSLASQPPASIVG